MVNDRVIDGVNLRGQHPLLGEGQPTVVVRGTPAICVRAANGGRLQMPSGLKTFQPGDYICTDGAMGAAWIVRGEEFRVQNYTVVGTTSGIAGDPITFPSANTVEHLQEEVDRLKTGTPPEGIPGIASSTSLGLEGAHPVTTTADHDAGGTSERGPEALPSVPAGPRNIPAPDPSPAAAVNRAPDPNEPRPAKQTSAPSQRVKQR